MTDEQRDWQDEQGKAGDPETQDQVRSGDLLKKGVVAVSEFVEGLEIPAWTTEAAVGTILGCLTVRAFTKAWPRLEKPVNAAGYLVGGYAAYRLVKAVFDQGAPDQALVSDASEECGRV